MAVESGLDKNQIISVLSKSAHGKLVDYVEMGKLAASSEPEFFAHLIVWDKEKGQIRDAKVALPVISLSVSYPDELVENSLACVASLNPRGYLQAYRFAKDLKIPGRMSRLKSVTAAYLKKVENSRDLTKMLVQHRKSLIELYALTHTKPSTYVADILFNKVRLHGTIQETIAYLSTEGHKGNISPVEAARMITEHHIPFIITQPALGKRVRNEEFLLALVKSMTPTEVVSNLSFLEKAGVRTFPASRAALQDALARVAKSRQNVLKTTRAIEKADVSDTVKEKLRGVQEKQIATIGVEGNWAVLADCSSSMSKAIQTAREVAATLTKSVKGRVHLIFFNSGVRYMDVTGKTLDEIKSMTQYIIPAGSTSIGMGLDYLLQAGKEVDGIAVVSDGHENTAPFFFQVFPKYCKKFKEVPVYFYRLPGDRGMMDIELEDGLGRIGVPCDIFDLSSADYYSLPNMVQTMRSNRYSLIDEIMATSLLTLEKAGIHL